MTLRPPPPLVGNGAQRRQELGRVDERSLVTPSCALLEMTLREPTLELPLADAGAGCGLVEGEQAVFWRDHAISIEDMARVA